VRIPQGLFGDNVASAPPRLPRIILIHYTSSFSNDDPKSAKKANNLTVFFCTFGIYANKSCSLKVGEIDPKTCKLDFDQDHQL
jgi:hypothetical protein